MTNQQHPITPPAELVQGWYEDKTDYFIDMIRAAQWGADQELEACCDWLGEPEHSRRARGASELRAARRPKPMSLKEQALALLNKAEDPSWDINDFSIVRKALEQLDD